MTSCTDVTQPATLTVQFDDMEFAGPATGWLIEANATTGEVHTFGEGEIIAYRGTSDDELWIETSETDEQHGGHYSGPTRFGRVDLYSDHDHYLAVFDTEDAMLAGAREILDHFGDELPQSVRRELAKAARIA